MSEEEDFLKAFPAAAEYLTTIHLLCRDYGFAANNRLAEILGVSTSAVTQALGRLKKKGLVDQERYEHIQLTPQGRLLALTVLKRHYLLEHLLVKILEFPWDKSDEEAKVLQNQISPALADHLDVRLGFPQTCPHGNPMPGSAIEAKLLSAPRLDQVGGGEEVVILRITEEGEGIPAMLPLCQLLGVKPGVRFAVRSWQGNELLLSAVSLPGTEVRFPRALAKHVCYEAVSGK